MARRQYVQEYLVCLSLLTGKERRTHFGGGAHGLFLSCIYASMAYGRKRKHEQLKRRRAKERNCTDAQPCLYVEVRSRTAHRTFAVSTDQGVTPARRVRGGVLWQLAGVRSTREAEARLFAVDNCLVCYQVLYRSSDSLELTHAVGWRTDGQDLDR